MPQRNEESVNRAAAYEAAREIAIAFAPPAVRTALRTLLALDDRLRGIVAATSQPMIGQLRLAWWRDALTALGSAPVPAEPLLRAVEAEIVPLGLDGVALAELADAWEARLIDGDDVAAVSNHGARLFVLAARLLGIEPGDRIAAAGESWGLYNLLAAAPGSVGAADRAGVAYHRAFAEPWPREERALGILTLLARADADPTGSGLRHWLRLLRFRATGR